MQLHPPRAAGGSVGWSIAFADVVERQLTAARNPARLADPRVSVRADLRVGEDVRELREEFREALKSEISGLESRFITKLDSKIDEVRGEFRTEMRALKDELGSQMRTLHKDTVARIALINRG